MMKLGNFKRYKMIVANILMASLALVALFCDRMDEQILNPTENTQAAANSLHKNSQGDQTTAPSDKSGQPPSAGLASSGAPTEKGYYVWLYIDSHKRVAEEANDSGESEWYCKNADMNETQCGTKPYDCGGPPELYCFNVLGEALPCANFRWIDGLYLASYKNERHAGLWPEEIGPQKRIEGSLNSCEDNNKWEWPTEGDIDNWNLPSSVRTTERTTTDLLTYEYETFWTGSSISATIKLKWKENDQGPDDKSEWIYLDTGDLITQCLQGGVQGQERTIVSEDDFLIEAENGDYEIRVYYSVACEWTKIPWCGDDECASETWQSCPSDCDPRPCNNDGFCDWEWGEEASNCPNDCEIF